MQNMVVANPLMPAMKGGSINYSQLLGGASLNQNDSHTKNNNIDTFDYRSYIHSKEKGNSTSPSNRNNNHNLFIGQLNQPSQQSLSFPFNSNHKMGTLD